MSPPNLPSYKLDKQGSNNKEMEIRCVEKERDALLQFKHGIVVDRCGLLASWGDTLDCCQWHGIHCSKYTGHVISLHLHGFLTDEYNSMLCLEGTISVSLAELKHLKYLDLSFNNFQWQPIPKFIGSLAHLEHLNLSNAGFGGVIPHEIGNLSRLSSLDLNCLYVEHLKHLKYSMSISSLSWLSNLRLLRDINLGGIDLSLVLNWVSIINSLPFLEALRMDQCGLTSKLPSSLSYINSSETFHVISLAENYLDSSIYPWFYNLSKIETSLAYLNLSFTQLREEIPSFIWKMNSLSHLDLGGNSFSGQIPSEVGNMHNLTFLNLYYNKLSGQIPREIGKLCRLQTLHLDGNNFAHKLSQIIDSFSSCAHKSLVSLTLSYTQVWGSVPNNISIFSSLTILQVSNSRLNGTISEGIGQLSRLQELDLSYNRLNGVISHDHFSNLSRLSVLDLSNNQALVLNLSANWTPPFQLNTLKLGPCKIGSNFPKWFLTQHNITSLDISDAGICDIIPKSFWGPLSSNLQYLNMSNNMIYGVLSDLQYLNMSNNMIYGVLSDLPFSFPSLNVLDMSSNNLRGAIPSFLGSNVSELYLNNNQLSEGLFRFLSPKTEMALNTLDLSNNLFSETLPDYWTYFPYLIVLKLQNNNISGNLPSSIASINRLQILHLRKNSLYGKLPMSWVNSTSLVVLDLAYNSLSGYIPLTFGQDLKKLNVLSLRNNKLSMDIPSNLCQLSCLRILDLSRNHISGPLPKCLYNLKAMANAPNFPEGCDYFFIYSGAWISDNIWFMWKRKEQNFKDLLGLLKGIDISDNNLQGQIPYEISRLAGLVFLNLSQNNLSGAIPSRIGQLTSLQFLDLSQNHLSGEIPPSLASIDSLEILDLSKNNLSGKIPLGTQLQGFNASTYMGNPGLCGEPLPRCPGDQATPTSQNGDNFAKQYEHKSDDIFLGLYVSVVLGFITGFWGVCGILVLKRSWRHAFFRLYDDTKDRVYVMVVMNIARAFRRC